MLFKKIDECEGKILGNDIIDDDERLILSKGQTLTDKIISRLKNFGIYYLVIEDGETDDIDARQSISESTVIDACNAIINYDVDKTFIVADKLVKEIINNSELLNNGYIILKEYDENTCLHSVNVAITSVNLGLSLGLSTTRLKNLGVGALLHDIGKSKIPLEILNKAGRLSADEMALMRKHPQYGWDMLNEDIMIPAVIKGIVLQHHENWDGSGYPFGWKEHNILGLASIVHICDVYDALISKRSYKDAFSYYDTIEYLKSQSGKMFSPYYLDYFFKYVPIFKTGMEVKLNNGINAVIVKNTPGDMTRPVVRLLGMNQTVDLRTTPDTWIES